MRLVLLVAVLLVYAGEARAAPEGFRESARLTPKARALSGNPRAVVYCATSAEAYAARRLALGKTELAAGFTVYSENAAYFPSYTCGALERWLRGKPATRFEVGVAALTLGHEAGHLSGERDERTVECRALAALATTLRAQFGVKSLATLRDMVAAARADNARRSAIRC